MNLSRYTHRIFNILSIRLFAAGLFLLLNGVLQPAHAAGNLFVTTTGTGAFCTQVTPCDLQVASNSALDGDTVYIAGGNYTSPFQAVIFIARSITFYGGWDGTTTTPPVRDPEAYVTTIDGEDARRGIYVWGNITPVVDGLQIIRGNAAGLGGYEYPAGYIYDAGGGVYVLEASVTLTNTIISNSSAEYGGGVFLNNSPGTLTGNTISGNNATLRGGGGVVVYKNAPTLSNNAITSNTAFYQGGGLYLFETTASLQNNMITDNDAGSHGGGVSVASCNPVFTGNIIARNKANNGAGIRLWYSKSTFVNNVFVDNQLILAGGSGSALEILGSSPDLKHTTFARNSGGDGSGIFISMLIQPRSMREWMRELQ